MTYSKTLKSLPSDTQKALVQLLQQLTLLQEETARSITALEKKITT